MSAPAPRTVLITGASSGIGRATALRFARDGWRVIATGRNAEALAALEAEMAAVAPPAAAAAAAAAGSLFKTITFDVADQQSVEAALAPAALDHWDIDVLVNNAGLALGLSKAQDARVDHWQTMVNTNVNGMLYVTHALLPRMVARNAPGSHIMFVSSIAGQWPYVGGNVYGATKAFVTQFALNLRTDLLGTAVRVTSLEPGMVETPFSNVRFESDMSKVSQVYDGVQSLTAEDCAETILWATTQPAHVNVNRIEIMPIQQAYGGLAVHRDFEKYPFGKKD
ncbi:hypothetical protein H696_04219 [Fonticula alba]|uniref:Ketoreductase domain-containing protein n=1 Tax=Fonticula alba TaxID=691883 RepID=A0A058Z3F9_FONAL|nr:hypothetical protein H696_04219 [Fonticula alba]KCV68800.1 hypothetical protein H696_04219 [Fonticula alba]|eukprot:XP_009496371.1 hypothetical protein H696_04219 [Fonticula alba]